MHQIRLPWNIPFLSAALAAAANFPIGWTLQRAILRCYQVREMFWWIIFVVCQVFELLTCNIHLLSHYTGVCIEFCIVTRRLDLLFGPIFRCFYEARYINVFLDVMETYILNDRLTYVAPEAMVLFVSHCKDMKDLSMVKLQGVCYWLL